MLSTTIHYFFPCLLPPPVGKPGNEGSPPDPPNAPTSDPNMLGSNGVMIAWKAPKTSVGPMACPPEDVPPGSDGNPPPVPPLLPKMPGGSVLGLGFSVVWDGGLMSNGPARPISLCCAESSVDCKTLSELSDGSISDEG